MRYQSRYSVIVCVHTLIGVRAIVISRSCDCKLCVGFASLQPSARACPAMYECQSEVPIEIHTYVHHLDQTKRKTGEWKVTCLSSD
ncbi:uncharacterized protein BJ212DRAFT_1336298, partial [Suillus subaureus]